MLRHRPLPFVFVAVVISCCLEQASSFPRNRNVVACKGIKLTKLGCYRDNLKRPRLLPQLISTDRDDKSRVYSNVPINWGKWNDYMPGLICRCASKSLSKGYNVMGLQYYGECWSGANSAKYYRDGTSTKCITFDYKPCKRGLDCVGKENANFVYRVEKDTPSGSPTKKPTTKITTPTQSSTSIPTPSNTPSPSPSPTPPSTPSPSSSPSPTSPSTPSLSPSPSPSPPPFPSPPQSTTPRSPSASPTPSGSATSTAKRPNVPTSSQSPCKAPSCSNMGQQQPECFPHCHSALMLPPPAVVVSPPLYPGGTYPQQQGCPQSMCPVQCAPQCTTSCCNSV